MSDHQTCMGNKSSVNERPFLLQPSSYQVWVQAIARLFYQAGHGSIHFFMPLIFVNQWGFSATAVGIGMGSGSIASVLGHFLGGYLADSSLYGRKRTLLFSAGLSILAAVVLALTQTLPMLILVNLIMGLSSGCSTCDRSSLAEIYTRLGEPVRSIFGSLAAARISAGDRESVTQLSLM